MMNSFLFVLTLLAALGCAMMAGVFFAFSGFVMKALARLQPAQGVAAMQAINVAKSLPPSWRCSWRGTNALPRTSSSARSCCDRLPRAA